jgi:glucosyl-dolichyl phosphate glucuronosyltransferase
MKISVIIPTFNRSKILPLCLDSLVNQNYPKDKYEVIIVDNNSIDDTEAVVSSYIDNYQDVLIRYLLENEPGAGIARNLGVEKAKFDILAFSDDDGIFCKNWLQEISISLSQNPKAVALAGKILIKWDKEPPRWVFPYEWLLGNLDYGNEQFYKTNLYINAGNFIIKKNIFNAVGGFSTGIVRDYLVEHSEDGINKRLAKEGYIIGWAPKALMNHYQVVVKNASINDIKRRHKNLGIAKSYTFYINNKYKPATLLFFLLKKLLKYCIYQIRVVQFSTTRNYEKKLQSIFLKVYTKSQLTCLIKLASHPTKWTVPAKTDT